MSTNMPTKTTSHKHLYTLVVLHKGYEERLYKPVRLLEESLQTSGIRQERWNDDSDTDYPVNRTFNVLYSFRPLNASMSVRCFPESDNFKFNYAVATYYLHAQGSKAGVFILEQRVCEALGPHFSNLGTGYSHFDLTKDQRDHRDGILKSILPSIQPKRSFSTYILQRE